MGNLSQTKLWAGATALAIVVAFITALTMNALSPQVPVVNHAAVIDGSRPAIQDIVRDYLLQNPEIVRDSLIELERRDQIAEASQQQQAIADNRDQIFNSETDVVVGNPNGDITLVEFFDYNCGFCKRALADLNRLLEDDPNLRVVLKEFPVLSQGSIEAARVSIASADQGKYLELHRALFDQRGAIDGARALEVAETLGLDADRLAAAASEPKKNEIIANTLQIATALGINGTPSYVIGDQLVIGAVGYDQLKATIEAERERLKAGS
ncbi:MAG: DsbA family protein [Fimbriimonadaceae bacterium]|nr:DsbA family protein [Alphaproteobacteria bacterium]